MAESDALASLLPKDRRTSHEPPPPPTSSLSISAKEWQPTASPAASGTQSQSSASTYLRADAAGFTPAVSPAQGPVDYRLPPEHLTNWQNDRGQDDDSSSCEANQVIIC